MKSGFPSEIGSTTNRERSEIGRSWEAEINPTYITACNLIMLQLDKAYLPIFQR